MTTEYAIGDYVVTAVDDHIGTPREKRVVFPEVTDGEWEPYRDIALNNIGQWQAQWRGHLIRRSDGSGPVILVDTGMGPGPHEHTGKHGQLLESLGALGVSPSDISFVVTTHCHGDHIGWNITRDDEGMRATFSSARYYIAANDWEHYSKPENANEAFDQSVAPLDGLDVRHAVARHRRTHRGIDARERRVGPLEVVVLRVLRDAPELALRLRQRRVEFDGGFRGQHQSGPPATTMAQMM